MAGPNQLAIEIQSARIGLFPVPVEDILGDFVKQRYASWDAGIGADIEKGSSSFEALEKYMLDKGEVTPNVSGRQEYLENVVNRYYR